MKAVGLLKKGTEKGEHFAKQYEADIAIMADLLRRAGQLGEASDLIEKNQDRITEDIIKKMLIFQKKLISQSDTECHTISECLKIKQKIDEDPQADPEESMDVAPECLDDEEMSVSRPDVLTRKKWWQFWK